MRTLITYGAFPLAFLSAQVGAWLAWTSGVPAPTVLAGVTALTALLVVALERIQPEFVEWNRPRDDVGTDALHALVSMIALPVVVETALRAALLSLAIAASMASPVALWPHHLPVLVQLPLALILSQFGEYWAHRLMHEHPLLWRLHATHHSPKRLYWLNAARFHPLDTATSITLNLTPLIILGVGEEVLLLQTVWIAVHGLFQHCNVHLRLGPLNWIFSMAELHRWHHSQVLKEANANYGNNLLFWDIIFRTVYWPSDRDAGEDVGLHDTPAFPQDYLGQLASPFTWNSIEEAGKVSDIPPKA